MESIHNLMSQLAIMQWSDVLDIVLVALIIYKLLPLIKAPSTARIAKVAVTIIIIAWLTDVAKLHTINFILSQFLAVGLLAFVVLFQPELRRMLDHLGNVRLSTFFSNSKPVQEMESVIMQTVMACDIMSREKVGALIVFAREQRLEEYFKTGTQLDARVSEQLLRNIFFPKASLHDGAMIIRDGRVAAAGCVLPLSDSVRLSADLGTRHRAGVGMSEVSDAVVVIVSEETGTISVAVGGMLKRHLAPETLEKMLRKELCPEETLESEQKLKNLVKNMARKKEDVYEK